MLILFLGLSVLTLGVFTFVWPAYDRYLWPLVVPLGVVLCDRFGRLSSTCEW